MKNQYFADINDYRKYGILRTLAGNGDLKTAICWMLTDDDLSTDGKKIAYLNNPSKWRNYDPDMFDSLVACLTIPGSRSVRWAEEKQLIPGAVYFSDVLKDDQSKREKYFQKFNDLASESDFVFFDPDNGIEVKSKPYGRKDSKKFIYWQELIDTFRCGKSILIYQHFPRVKREVFIQQCINKIRERLSVEDVYSLRSANVLFLLIPQYQHRKYIESKCAEISKKWEAQIDVEIHRRLMAGPVISMGNQLDGEKG